MQQHIIMLILEAIPKGKYEKLANIYNFEAEEGNYLIIVTNNSIEFRIKTIKWIPGSYEPIEGSQIYKTISFEELKALSEEDKVSIITENIEKIKND